MVSLWKRYDLRCRACGNVGFVGIGSDERCGDTIWTYEWVGFLGAVDRGRGPQEETIRCMQCNGRDVLMEKR